MQFIICDMIWPFFFVLLISIFKHEHDLHHHRHCIKVNDAAPWLSSTGFNYYNYFEIDTRVLTKIKDNHMAPAGCQLTIRNIAYIKYNHNHGHITSLHTPAKQS